jgi:hypothetical protein
VNAPTNRMAQVMNGLRVDRSENGSTIFVPLPRLAWRSCGPCDCPHCNGRDGFWDTVAIAATPARKGASDTTWTVHRPGGHPFHDRADRPWEDVRDVGCGWRSEGVYWTDAAAVAGAPEQERRPA